MAVLVHHHNYDRPWGARKLLPARIPGLMREQDMKKGFNIVRRLDFVHELFPRMKERRHQPAGTLSGGEQRMCAIVISLQIVFAAVFFRVRATDARRARQISVTTPFMQTALQQGPVNIG